MEWLKVHFYAWPWIYRGQSSNNKDKKTPKCITWAYFKPIYNDGEHWFDYWFLLKTFQITIISQANLSFAWPCILKGQMSNNRMIKPRKFRTFPYLNLVYNQSEHWFYLWLLLRTCPITIILLATFSFRRYSKMAAAAIMESVGTSWRLVFTYWP